MRKLNDFMDEVKKEIKQDKENQAKDILKERLLEIEAARKVLDKMEKQLTEILNKTIDEVVDA